MVGIALAGGVAASERTAAQVYQVKCSTCHAKDGKGSTYGKKLGVPDISAVALPETAIVQSVTIGKGKMPAHSDRLTPDEILAVARYVKGGLK
jgi:mono/diheme cytochrome c family protein